MHNLELPLKIDDPIYEQIRRLSERIDQDYRATKDERRGLAEWEENQEFSVLGVIELYSSDIQGYAAQVLTRCYTTSFDISISRLRQLDLLGVSYLADWYFATQVPSPKLKQYIETLDHLRLLLIEYFTQLPVKSKSPASAD